MGRKKGVQKPQAEISKIKHVQDEDMTLKLKEVMLNFYGVEFLYQIFKFSDDSDLTRFTMQRSNNRS